MISVLMSVYNEELDWLKESVESILRQDYSDIEFIIVVDNPCIADELKLYLEDMKNNDSRIILYYNSENIGLMSSLNVGLSLAKGKYIARMDADDISMESRLKIELEYLKTNKFDMVSSNRIFIDENGNELLKGSPLTKQPRKCLPYTNFIVHSSVLIKADVLRDLGGYRKFYNSEDYDLWLRLLSHKYEIGIINEYLIYYRIRNNSMSYRNQLEQYYINIYQRKLYRERVRTGKDSFSEENLRNYIEKKSINNKKIKKYIYTRNMLNKTIDEFKSKNWRFVIHFSMALFCYPSVVCSNVRNILCML